MREYATICLLILLMIFGYFQFGATMDKASRNVLVQVFLWAHVFISLG